MEFEAIVTCLVVDVNEHLSYCRLRSSYEQDVVGESQVCEACGSRVAQLHSKPIRCPVELESFEQVLKQRVEKERAEWVALFDATLDVERTTELVSSDMGALLRV